MKAIRATLIGAVCAGFVGLAVAPRPIVAAGGTLCESMSALSLPNTTITSAQTVAAGGFAPPAAPGRAGGPDRGGQAFANLPSFCRVSATLKPSSDSDIKIEVWLPVTGWNSKFEAVGNGGFAGSISYAAMAEALRRGYATSSTDTGHSGGGASFAMGHPEKLIDFGYRSVHEMTVTAKTLVGAFYGNGPQHSYFNGCSTGGRQALQEAQRFPADFNGIIAGAAGHVQPRLLSGVVWVAQAALKDPQSSIPSAKYPAIHKAVLDACDAIDGLKDGLLDDPTRCHFDPKVLQCKGADRPECLTPAQVETAKKIMAPDPRTGSEVFLGLERGSELGWGGLTGGPDPNGDGVGQFKYIVFEDPNWDWRSFNAKTDVARAENAYGGIINASDPNLRPFAFHGGKLLTYQGWADTTIPSRVSTAYYESVQETMGGVSKTQDWYRLFMVPGMGHCRGGEGPNTFDMLTALEQWVEKGKAPEQIVASHSTAGKVDRTRPLCPYPQVARYKGAGSIDEVENFSCRMP
ncbi:MAG: tannase/feruloyl esterase family alpha/beta hydrolase [Acidobacteriota bacterium]